MKDIGEDLDIKETEYSLIKIMVYGQTAHNRTVYASPAVGGLGLRFG
jgi:hypothetical protein